MNQDEVTAWLEILPYFARGNVKLRRCRTDAERIEILEDLLKNASEDKMTEEDRVICVETLKYLRLNEQTTEATQETVVPVGDETSGSADTPPS